jgi:transposase
MIEGYRRCCGIDIHKDTVVVCVLPLVGVEGQAIRKTFGTFRNDLIRMRVWLKQLKVNEVAMESTGVYFALSSALFRRVQVPLALG